MSRSTARACGAYPPDAADGLRDAQLLIADGHHRYESAVELGEELGSAVRIMALVVPTDDAGLELFPTHRVFVNRADVATGDDDEPAASLEDALARLEEEAYDQLCRGQVPAGPRRSPPWRHGRARRRARRPLRPRRHPVHAATGRGRRSCRQRRRRCRLRPPPAPRRRRVRAQLAAAGACLRRARTSIRSPVRPPLLIR